MHSPRLILSFEVKSNVYTINEREIAVLGADIQEELMNLFSNTERAFQFCLFFPSIFFFAEQHTLLALASKPKAQIDHSTQPSHF